jgi:hypothetical protein
MRDVTVYVVTIDLEIQNSAAHKETVALNHNNSVCLNI